MILNSTQVAETLDGWRQGQPIDDDTAQTIASWWHAPTSPALSELSHRGTVSDPDGLRGEVQDERDGVIDIPEREELDALLGWLDRRG